MKEKEFQSRPFQPNRILHCGCEQKEEIDKLSGYFVWKTIKFCKRHEEEKRY